ncbi:MAG: hypothetical protein HYV27_21955 [Candidatus Hydrogenedentes bacterium]|nr:hypothetical protein [Candidatus Hydrogenedentota bacterium]
MLNREAALYAPIRDFLEAQGYTVRGEVKACDIAAAKDGAHLIVELKLRLSLDLILQSVQRQKLGGTVYLGVPESALPKNQKQWRRMQHLLRRLELGLLTVTEGKPPRVRVVLLPTPFQRRQQKKAQRALLEELHNRKSSANNGGSTRVPHVTAYREEALLIASILQEIGPATPKQLRERGASARTQSIVYDDHYGWFQRIERGVYALSAKGEAALKTYAEVVALLRDVS